MLHTRITRSNNLQFLDSEVPIKTFAILAFIMYLLLLSEKNCSNSAVVCFSNIYIFLTSRAVPILCLLGNFPGM